MTDDEAAKWDKVAQKMGLAKDAADKLAESIGLIPGSQDVSVRVKVDEATLRGVRNKLRANGFRFDET